MNFDFQLLFEQLCRFSIKTTQRFSPN